MEKKYRERYVLTDKHDYDQTEAPQKVRKSFGFRFDSIRMSFQGEERSATVSKTFRRNSDS